MAALSKYHFHRLFAATYGLTPAAYVSERRIERSQDLLRSTNLTVTEVCFAVGLQQPRLVQQPVPRRSSARRRASSNSGTAVHRPADPGLLRLHVRDWSSAGSASRGEADRPQRRHSVGRMITNVSLVSVWVTDLDDSLAFYTDVLGFEARDDIKLGEDFRWVTVGPPEPARAPAAPDHAEQAVVRRPHRGA